jgi:16S rRNA (adenine1518-N6/adenine1519-N6)-dimethyltransferase
MDILALLKREGFSFSKKYGQNFITDFALLEDIACDAEVNENDTVVEIGAGAGTLTTALARKAKRVISFEIDRTLEPVLNRTLNEFDNVELIFDDITKWTEEELDDLIGGEYKVVANLPYYITTPLLFTFLERKYAPSSITVMVQKEVAERICATEKKGDYGALSVSVALRGKAEMTRIVNRDKFTPPPNVDSAIVKIVLTGRVECKDEKALFSLVKKAFMMKRKTLVNNLSAGYSVSKTDASELLESLGLTPTVRAEQLSPQQFIELSNLLVEKNIK